MICTVSSHDDFNRLGCKECNPKAQVAEVVLVYRGTEGNFLRVTTDAGKPVEIKLTRCLVNQLKNADVPEILNMGGRSDGSR